MDFCRGFGIRIQSSISRNLKATSSCSTFATGSRMNQNTLLKREYFELYRMLNRSNLHKNQRTDILFFIEPENGSLILYSTANQTYRIQLISKKVKYNWEPSGFSGLFNLERQVSSFANNQGLEKINPDELTKKIKSFVFQNFK
jgi:poly-D-alanine transfer protein DltD